MGQQRPLRDEGHSEPKPALRAAESPRLMPVLQAAVLFNDQKPARKRSMPWE